MLELVSRCAGTSDMFCYIYSWRSCDCDTADAVFAATFVGFCYDRQGVLLHPFMEELRPATAAMPIFAATVVGFCYDRGRNLLHPFMALTGGCRFVKTRVASGDGDGDERRTRCCNHRASSAGSCNWSTTKLQPKSTSLRRFFGASSGGQRCEVAGCELPVAVALAGAAHVKGVMW